MSKRFETELQALHYPKTTLDVDNALELRTLIGWLEDRKIRALEECDREGLRNTGSDQWMTSCSSYLEELGCPFEAKEGWSKQEKLRILQWLIGYAIATEYADDAEEYAAVADTMKSRGAKEEENEITDEVIECLNKTAALLEHPPIEDPDTYLHMLTKLSRAVFGDKGGEKANSVSKLAATAGLGFDTGDERLNLAAKILRVHYLEDLREFQTATNEFIAGMQEFTAKPKTNAKLGKVGV